MQLTQYSVKHLTIQFKPRLVTSNTCTNWQSFHSLETWLSCIAAWITRVILVTCWNWDVSFHVSFSATVCRGDMELNWQLSPIPGSSTWEMSQTDARDTLVWSHHQQRSQDTLSHYCPLWTRCPTGRINRCWRITQLPDLSWSHPCIKWSDQLWDTLYNTPGDIWRSAIRGGTIRQLSLATRLLMMMNNENTTQNLLQLCHALRKSTAVKISWAARVHQTVSSSVFVEWGSHDLQCTYKLPHKLQSRQQHVAKTTTKYYKQLQYQPHTDTDAQIFVHY